MKNLTKITALALALTAAGATGAIAGKATTPNSTTPSVFFTVVQTIHGLSAADFDGAQDDGDSVFIASIVSALQ